jgi:signal transduction histidine kinase
VDGSKTIDEIANLPDDAFKRNQYGLSAGYTKTVHWLRFDIAPPVDPGKEWWLEVHPAYLDDLRLYAADASHPGKFVEHRTGDFHPFSSRDVPYRSFLFKLPGNPATTQTLYLRLQTTSSSLIMLKAWSPTKFGEAIPAEYALLGAAFGILSIILIVNFIYWWHQRDITILFYLAYIGAAFVNSFIVQGFFAQFVAPDYPAALNHLQFSSAMLMASSGGALYRRLLLVTSRERWLNAYFAIMIFLPLVMLLLYVTGYEAVAIQSIISISTLTILVCIWRAGVLLKQQEPGSRLVFLATTSGLSPLFFVFLQTLGLFAGSYFVLHIFLIGLIGTVISLHLAIGERMRQDQLQRQKEREQGRELESMLHYERATREEQATFIAMLSHELRTPIAGIAAATDAIEIIHAGKSESIQTRIERIRRAIRRIIGVADRYLQLDRADTGRQKPDIRRHDLSDVVALALEIAAGDEPRCEVQIADGIAVDCDRDLLGTAIANLIDNALKYSPASSVVSISGRRTDDQQIILEVADRGDGVAEEMHEAIFHRYVRAPEHGKIPGIGVGLALVRKIVELHGGEIVAMEREGGGAVFRLTLPG